MEQYIDRYQSSYWAQPKITANIYFIHIIVLWMCNMILRQPVRLISISSHSILWNDSLVYQMSQPCAYVCLNLSCAISLIHFSSSYTLIVCSNCEKLFIIRLFSSLFLSIRLFSNVFAFNGCWIIAVPKMIQVKSLENLLLIRMIACSSYYFNLNVDSSRFENRLNFIFS